MSTRNETRRQERLLPGVAALALAIGFGMGAPAQADEEYARGLMKQMSEYLASQDRISFDYDSNLEVVTKENQKLGLLSSGTVSLMRPDKLHATRTGGFLDTALIFDGQTLTFLGKNANLYSQLDIPGTTDNLINQLKDKYQRPLPAADLLLTDAAGQMMEGVTDVKDLGSGVVQGVECDHLAFRNAEVDWQIWIAQGDEPYPCQYSITTRELQGAPQYTVQIRNWKTAGDVAKQDFSFDNTTNAERVPFQELPNPGDVPEHYQQDEPQ